MNLNLNLETYKNELSLTKKGETTYIKDIIRKKWVVLQPEEMVRQLLILYLIIEKKYPQNLIQLEKKIAFNQLNKRFDIVVYNQKIKPIILIECKAHYVALDQKVFDQAARYNLGLEANYFILTNGVSSFCAELKDNSYAFLTEIPEWRTVNL